MKQNCSQAMKRKMCLVSYNPKTVNSVRNGTALVGFSPRIVHYLTE